MEIEARHVRRKQLSQYLDKDLLNRERKSVELATTQSFTSKIRQRVSSDSAQSAAKRCRATDSVSIYTLADNCR